MDRVLKAWGIDGHNSHTNVCSASARLGLRALVRLRPAQPRPRERALHPAALVAPRGRPLLQPARAADHRGQARGREARGDGPAPLATPPRMADYWLPTYPGSEAAVLLAMAKVLLDEGLADLDYVERWTNWREYLARPASGRRADASRASWPRSRSTTGSSRPSSPRPRAGCRASRSWRWRGASARPAAPSPRTSGAARPAATWAAGRWRARCSSSPCSPAAWARRAAPRPTPGTSTSRTFWEEPPPQKEWNELLFPKEWPLSHYEMCFLLPHFLKEGRGKLDVYFTRVYNPVWTNPDGMTWMEVLQDESLVGLHAALTPTWSETAAFADYVLPMGHAGERHDIQSQETQSGKWVSFRQPVLRAARERLGETLPLHLRGEPGRGLGGGRVLDRALLAHRPRRRARHPPATSSRPTRPGEKLTVHEYYRWIFENAVPGPARGGGQGGAGAPRVHAPLRRLPDRERRPRAAREGGERAGGRRHRPRDRHRDARTGKADRASRWTGEVVAGFPTPSRQARDLLAHPRGLGLARGGAAGLHQEPRPPRGASTPRRGEMVLAARPSACPRSSTPAPATRST